MGSRGDTRVLSGEGTRRGLPPAKHGRIAGLWRRAIAVGLQRDVTKSALRIKDGSLQANPPSRLHHFAIDLGRVLARRSLASPPSLHPRSPLLYTALHISHHGCLPPDCTTFGLSWLHLTSPNMSLSLNLALYRV